MSKSIRPKNIHNSHSLSHFNNLQPNFKKTNFTNLAQTNDFFNKVVGQYWRTTLPAKINHRTFVKNSWK